MEMELGSWGAATTAQLCHKHAFSLHSHSRYCLIPPPVLSLSVSSTQFCYCSPLLHTSSTHRQIQLYGGGCFTNTSTDVLSFLTDVSLRMHLCNTATQSRPLWPLQCKTRALEESLGLKNDDCDFFWFISEFDLIYSCNFVISPSEVFIAARHINTDICDSLMHKNSASWYKPSNWLYWNK